MIIDHTPLQWWDPETAPVPVDPADVAHTGADQKMTLDGLLGALKANLEAAAADPDWERCSHRELILQGEPGDDATKKLLDRGVLRIRIQVGDPHGMVALLAPGEEKILVGPDGGSAGPAEGAPEGATPPG